MIFEFSDLASIYFSNTIYTFHFLVHSPETHCTLTLHSHCTYPLPINLNFEEFKRMYLLSNKQINCVLEFSKCLHFVWNFIVSSENVKVCIFLQKGVKYRKYMYVTVWTIVIFSMCPVYEKNFSTIQKKTTENISVIYNFIRPNNVKQQTHCSTHHKTLSISIAFTNKGNEYRHMMNIYKSSTCRRE